MIYAEKITHGSLLMSNQFNLLGNSSCSVLDNIEGNMRGTVTGLVRRSGMREGGLRGETD